MARRSAGRCSVIAAIGSLLLILPVSVGDAAEGGTTRVGMAEEAWHTTTPAGADPCADPVDCAQAPGSPVFPAHTLHVAIEAGQQTAATYLQLDTSKIPFGAHVRGGMLRLPVDDQAGDGSLRPESARLVACPVMEPVQEASGSPASPPKTDCKAASVPAKYDNGKQAAFEVDVAPLADVWADGNAAVAIMPSPKAEKDGDTWHVAFWGKKNKDPKAAPITATLSYRAEPAVPPLTDPSLGGLPAAPEPIAALPEADLPQSAPAAAKAPPNASPPQKAPPPETARQAAPAFRTVGYAYPIAWSMPLVLLIGFAMTGHALTKRLNPAAIHRR